MQNVSMVLVTGKPIQILPFLCWVSTQVEWISHFSIFKYNNKSLIPIALQLLIGGMDLQKLKNLSAYVIGLAYEL